MTHLFSYDDIANDYDQISRARPMRRYVDWWLCRRELNQLKRGAVLDLACGSGCYIDILDSLGFSPIVGVDKSIEMLRLARQRYPERSDIELINSSVEAFVSERTYPVITAGWLISYCKNITELKKLCTSIRRLLAPGGVFFTTFGNAEKNTAVKYGVDIQYEQPLIDGRELNVTFLGDEPFKIHTTFFFVETVIEALLAAGFKNVEQLSLEIDPEGIRILGRDYWQDMLQLPMMSVLKITG